MADDYKSYGLKLLKNGYVPLPLKHGEKRPAVKSWSEVKVTEDKVNSWSSQLPGGGVGLRGGELVALDIDITMSEGVVDELISYCEDNIGTTMIRMGKAPKVALFYRTDEPFSRTDSAYYGDDPKLAQHIEARSLDTQTVVYGVHPDTHKNYEWLSKSTPLNTHIDELTTITQDQVTELYEYLDDLAAEQHWPLQVDAMPDSPDSGGWMKGKYEISDVDLITALGHIDADDYHRWVSVGMALHHQYEGDDQGLQMWNDWSQKSSKYDGGCDTKWDTFKDTGKRSTATVGSILHIAAAKGWKNPGIQHEAPEPEFPVQADDTPNLPLSQFAPTGIWDSEPPEVPWIIKDFMPANKVCMLTAPGGTGKSFLVLQLAFSIATGVPLCGHWDGITRGGVVVLSAEDDVDDMHRRMKAIIATVEDDFAYSLDDIERIKSDFMKNFRFISMVGKNGLFTHKSGGSCEQTKAVDWMINAIKKLPDTVVAIIDPIARFKDGDENNQADMTMFITALERIKNETQVGLLALHHANKASMREGGATEQYAARGASALTDGVRWQANMARMHPDDANDFGVRKSESGHYVQLAIAKTNYTAPGGGVWLKRGEGGVLSVVEMDKYKKQRDASVLTEINDKIVAIVQRYEDQGNPISPRKLQRDYGGKENEIGIPINQVPRHVDALVGEMVLRKCEKVNKVGGGFVLKIAKIVS